MTVKNKTRIDGKLGPSSQEEVIRRVEYTIHLLRQGPHLKSRIIKKLKEKYGIQWRMANKYLTAAREHILLHLEDVKEHHRADSLSLYEGVLTNPKATPLEKIKAQERIDKLLGLEAPVLISSTHVFTGVMGKNLESLDLDLETRKKLLVAIRDRNIREKKEKQLLAANPPINDLLREAGDLASSQVTAV